MIHNVRQFELVKYDTPLKNVWICFNACKRLWKRDSNIFIYLAYCFFSVTCVTFDPDLQKENKCFCFPLKDFYVIEEIVYIDDN